MPIWNVGQTDTGSGSSSNGSLWGPANGNRAGGNSGSRKRAGNSIPDQFTRAIQNGSDVPTSAKGVDMSGNYGSWYSTLQGISDSNNAFNLDQVNMVNAFNAKEAEKQRAWQTEMSNTAHQREVRDLISAGLNPVLSAGGQGAVTGSGAVASGQKAVADNTLGNGVMSLMSSMISAASAQSVAQTYAAASMYGSDVNAKTQREYQRTIKEIAYENNWWKPLQAAMPFLSTALRSAL